MPTKLSYDDIRQAVCLALNAGRAPNQSVYVRSIYDDKVVYEDQDISGGYGLYSRDYSIDADANVTLGDTATAVTEVHSYEPVKPASFTMFAASREVDGDYVIRTGKVFELGNYPDKKFSLTETEADSVTCPGFVAVDNDVEHVETILSTKKLLGQLVSVFRNGKDLIGRVRIPKWLDSAMGDDPLKVSLAFGADKRIIGNALCLNPRITDAAVFSAAERGAGAPASTSRMEGQAMDETTFINKLLNGIKTAFGVSTAADPAAPVFASDPAKDAEIQRLKDANDKLAKAQKAESDKRVAEKAAAFADKAIADSLAVPAEKDALIAQFTLAATDDAGTGALFTDAGEIAEGVRVKALRDGIAARVKHGFTAEQLKDGKHAVIFGGAPAPAKDELNTSDIYDSRKGGKAKS